MTELITLLNRGNDICITKELKGIESAVGPLSMENLVTIFLGGLAGGNSTIPKELLCSNCVKQAINVVNKDIPGLLSSDVSSTLSNTCGADFTST